MKRLLLLGVGLLFVFDHRAWGYDASVHAYLSASSYAGPRKLALESPSEAQANRVAAARRLRERLWSLAAQIDPQLAHRLTTRYGTLEHFDAWEFKRLLGLNPEKMVAGVDDVPLPAAGDGAALFALASRLPDDDERNRDRLRHDASRQVVRDQFGQPLPEDPATLEMGALTGLSSQAHAHYGLPHLAFSDDPQVLKTDPRRFAIPPTVHTFAAEFAEAYTELAVLAALEPGGERLALLHAGAAAHHIEDVANQIHTVQVGLYDFFIDAKLESMKEELRSLGGLLRPRPSFVSIGIDIITNHHLLAEALYAKHLLRPGDPVADLTRDTPADPALDARLRPIAAACAPGFGRAITEAVIEVSSPEGPDVYRQMRALAQPRFSRVGVHFHDSDDPDTALRPEVDTRPFQALAARGARRAEQAMAAWWQSYHRCVAPLAITERLFVAALLRDRLDALDVTEARARAFVPKPPERFAPNFWVPGGALLLALVMAGSIVVLRRRKQRKLRTGQST